MSDARTLLGALRGLATDAEAAKNRRHVRERPDQQVLGVRMKDVFDLARGAAGTPLDEVVALLGAPVYEARLCAVSILDAAARLRIDDDRRAALCATYLDHHDLITNWDMVDRAAPHVVGRWVHGRDRSVLHALAGHPAPLHRRTATIATLWWARFGTASDCADLLAVADPLLADPDPLVHLAAATAVKHGTGLDAVAVREFLAARAGRVPRAALRTAAGKLDPGDRAALLGS